MEEDSQDNDVSLGVYHGGILIYRNRLRLQRFSWPSILTLRIKKREFRLTARPDEGETFTRQLLFKCPSEALTMRLFRACFDHHQFFR
ncbi:unnamed protein product [Protopolystoma xenopodis]|uniref:FERM domain-containing protein n=1 Tax=Protopolystoma xenopodis TaxID=117903 RepID=A0A3S5FCA0_9PLAT|nr:unnamed protein product [Protopolystoma xenopodis]